MITTSGLDHVVVYTIYIFGSQASVCQGQKHKNRDM